MKKFLVFLVAIVIGTAFAETINVNWKVGDTTYSTSTCESGGNLIIPQTPPTKYGYTFVGWNYGIIKGTWSQSRTPTPSNPIEPVFYQLGDTVLRALGSGEKFIADEYNPSSEKITRYVGVKVLDGTEESWVKSSSSALYYRFIIPGAVSDWGARTGIAPLCTHVQGHVHGGTETSMNTCSFTNDFLFQIDKNISVSDFKQWLADQYANGTPVTVYYPLAEPVEESWSLSE